MHQDYRTTYSDLVSQCEVIARGLMARGVQRGDRVGIWSPNRFEWVIVQYATAKIGAILVNINPAYRTSELEFVLNQSGTRLLIAAERLQTSDYAAMITEVRRVSPAGRRSCCSAPPSGTRCWPMAGRRRGGREAARRWPP